MKHFIALTITLALLLTVNVCYADSETDIQDFIKFLEGERTRNVRVKKPPKDKAFFVETGVGILTSGIDSSHRRHHLYHEHLLSYDFNGKIGYNAGNEKWFFTLEYANTSIRCQYQYGGVPPSAVKERRTSYVHTGGIGIMYYPIPNLQISTTIPVGYNFSVAYDHKFNNNHSLLAGVKNQIGVGNEAGHQFVLFCKYRFVTRKSGGSR